MTAAVTGFGLSTVQVDTTRHLSPWQHLEEGQHQQQGLLQEKILVVAVEKATRLTVVGQPMVQQGLQQQQVQQQRQQ